jgi:hypothetical protein
VSRDLGHIDESAFRDGESANYSLPKMHQFIENIAAGDPLFLKEQRFTKQSEYRFIWRVNENRVREHLDICVPEARHYCTPFEDLELEFGLVNTQVSGNDS